MANSTVHDDRWIRRYSPAGDGCPRLVCFPHAGGSASFFFPLAKALEGEMDVAAVQYPGRQDRRGEPAIDDIGTLADHVAAALRPALDADAGGPGAGTVFFGHSMGAVIAFEVSRRVQRAGGPGPAALVVSGRRAPSPTSREQVHLRSDDSLIAELKELAGTEASVLGDEELLRLILPAVRNDYRAIERYVCGPGPRLTCPIVAFVGDGDPRVSAAAVQGWADFTVGPFSLDVFSGGHFYLGGRWGEVVAKLRERTAPRRAA